MFLPTALAVCASVVWGRHCVTNCIRLGDSGPSRLECAENRTGLPPCDTLTHSVKPPRAEWVATVVGRLGTRRCISWDDNAHTNRGVTCKNTRPTCPLKPPATTTQHNGGWLYTRELISREHVAFDAGFGGALLRIFENETVYDIGAGVGQFEVFSRGAIDVFAFDGGNNIEQIAGWHTPLRNDANYVVPAICWIDAGVPVALHPRGWVMSIEVGEHISKKQEAAFMDNLVRLSMKGIVLTWAVKGQGGHQHINTQNNDYVIAEMAARNMVYDKPLSDSLRKDVRWYPWLRNTIMVFRKPKRCTLFHSMQGRLGNQLFQLESMKGLAARSSCSLCVRGAELLASEFEGVPSTACTAQYPLRQATEGGYAHYHNWTFNDDTTIYGYLQSFRYFEPSLPGRVRFKEHVIHAAKRELQALRTNVTVGIHVRRGDTMLAGYPGTQPDAHWYQNVLRYHRKTHSSVIFVVVSEDREWAVKQPFFRAGDVYIAGPHRPAVDMAILAHCAYHVVSVGSFGWWGAFLGHGPVMYYRWQNMTHVASKGFVDANYYPSNWAIMD